MTTPKYYIGLDLGQAKDYTALAIVEHELIETGEIDYATYEKKVNPQWNLRHLERPPLKTSYPDIVSLVSDRVRALRKERKECSLIVDATGVGRPVVDMLRRARLGIPMTAATISAGASVTKNDFGIGVPKRDLVSNLQILFDSGHLRISGELPEAQILVKELMAFKAKINTAGHDSYEAWREGDHDDLVLSVALACWLARERSKVGFVTVPGLFL